MRRWLPALLAGILLVLAVVLYIRADAKGVDEAAVAAAIAAGAAGHLLLAHVRGMLKNLHPAVIVSLAMVGVIAGVIGVLTAKLSNADATDLALAVAGLGAAIAGAETLARLASRSLGAPQVSSLHRNATELTLRGDGLTRDTPVRFDGKQLKVLDAKPGVLTLELDANAGPGEPISIGSGELAAELALPKPAS